MIRVCEMRKIVWEEYKRQELNISFETNIKGRELDQERKPIQTSHIIIL